MEIYFITLNLYNYLHTLVWLQKEQGAVLGYGANGRARVSFQICTSSGYFKCSISKAVISTEF